MDSRHGNPTRKVSDLSCFGSVNHFVDDRKDKSFAKPVVRVHPRHIPQFALSYKQQEFLEKAFKSLSIGCGSVGDFTSNNKKGDGAFSI